MEALTQRGPGPALGNAALTVSLQISLQWMATILVGWVAGALLALLVDFDLLGWGVAGAIAGGLQQRLIRSRGVAVGGWTMATGLRWGLMGVALLGVNLIDVLGTGGTSRCLGAVLGRYPGTVVFYGMALLVAWAGSGLIAGFLLGRCLRFVTVLVGASALGWGLAGAVYLALLLAVLNAWPERALGSAVLAANVVSQAGAMLEAGALTGAGVVRTMPWRER